MSTQINRVSGKLYQLLTCGLNEDGTAAEYYKTGKCSTKNCKFYTQCKEFVGDVMATGAKNLCDAVRDAVQILDRIDNYVNK